MRRFSVLFGFPVLIMILSGTVGCVYSRSENPFLAEKKAEKKATEAATAPAKEDEKPTTPPAKGAAEETITPSADPVVSAPEKPAGESKPSTPKGDSTKTGEKPSESTKPGSGTDPVIVGDVKPITVDVSIFKPVADPAPKGVQLGEKAYVACEGCGGSEGTPQDFLCQNGHVMVGFSYSKAAYNVCDSSTSWYETEGSIGGDTPESCLTPIVGGLRIFCAPLALEQVDRSGIGYALASGTDADGNLAFDDLAGSEPADSEGGGGLCEYKTGLANGLFGRAGGAIDSIGAFCGHYYSTSKTVGVLPTFNKTASCDEESEYGCSPGAGGSPFEVKCGVNQAIVGVRMKDTAAGIEGVFCSDVTPVF